MGDTVVALPAFWVLRTNFPSARITLLTNDDTRNPNYVSPVDVLPKTGLIDDSIAYPTNLTWFARAAAFANLCRKIRSRKFDTVFYLMPRIRSDRQIDRDLSFFRMCGIERVIGAEFIRQNSLPAVIPRPTPEVEHEASFMLNLLASENVEVKEDQRLTDLLLTDGERNSALDWFKRAANVAPRRLIAVAPGSKWRSKVWPEERFADVITKLVSEHNVFPIVFGGSEDSELGSRLIATWGTGVNAAGQLSVRESAAMLESCELYVGNDTGAMHLAAAVGTPCVAVFAAIDWIGRWAPIGAKNMIFRKRVACEGCLTPDCYNNNECLDLVSVEEVSEACLGILEAKAKQ